jgi:hypothetical protein
VPVVAIAASTRPTQASASGRAQRVLRSCERAPIPAACAQPSMQRLSDIGELGLLAELERRRLVHGIEDDTAQGRRRRRDAGRARRGRPLPPRLDHMARARLSSRGGEPQRSRGGWSDAEGLVVSLGAPSDTLVGDVLELYEGLAEPAVPIVGGDTTRADSVVVSVTAIGRSPRLRAAAAPPRRPSRGHGGRSAPRRRVPRGAYVRPPLRLEEGRRLAVTAHAMLTSRTGSSATRGHLAARSGCRAVIELDQVPLVPGATVEGPGVRRGLRAARCRRGARWLSGHRPLRGGRRRAPDPERRIRRTRLMGAFPVID